MGMGPNSSCTKWPDKIFPMVNFVFFPTMVTLVWGGGGLLRCTAILILPCPRRPQADVQCIKITGLGFQAQGTKRLAYGAAALGIW